MEPTASRPSYPELYMNSNPPIRCHARSRSRQLILFSLGPKLVKPTPTQIVLAYVASIFLLLTVFHRPLGLADYWEWLFMAVCVVALIGLSVARKRQKAARTGAASGERPKPNRKIMWLGLVLIIVTSLSSFLWLPYTGIAVSQTQLIMISITTSILSVADTDRASLHRLLRECRPRSVHRLLRVAPVCARRVCRF